MVIVIDVEPLQVQSDRRPNLVLKNIIESLSGVLDMTNSSEQVFHEVFVLVFECFFVCPTPV